MPRGLKFRRLHRLANLVKHNNLIAAARMAQLHQRRNGGCGDDQKRAEGGKRVDELQRHNALPKRAGFSKGITLAGAFS
jgi:hypothetical protein